MLLALYMETGSVRFTVQHYELVRELLSPEECRCENIQKLRSYKTVQNLFMNLIKTSFPCSIVTTFKVNLNLIRKMTVQSEEVESEADSRPESGDDDSCDTTATNGMAPVRIVLPSSWAKVDILTPSVYTFLSGSQTILGCFERTIETCNIFQKLSVVLESGKIVYARDGENIAMVTQGGFLEITASGPVTELQQGYKSERFTSSKYISQCQISAVWCVGSSSMRTSSIGTAMRSRILSADEKRLIFNLSASPSPREGYVVQCAITP